METATALAIVAVGASVAGTAVAVDSAQQQGKAARQSAQLEMQQYEEERKAAAQAAEQEQAAIQRNSMAATSALAARLAASGRDPYSGTGRVLLDQSLDDAAADLETSRANSGRVTGRLNVASQQSALTGNSRSSSAQSSAWGSVASGVGSIASIGSRNYLSRS
jgi:hypothetical protein